MREREKGGERKCCRILVTGEPGWEALIQIFIALSTSL